MGPAAASPPTGTNTGTDNQTTDLTDEQILALAKERNLSFSPETALGEDEKVNQVVEAMGGFNPPGNLTEEQKAAAKEELEKDTKIAIYQAEKEIAAVHPDLSEGKKFEVAKAFLQGDLTGLLKLAEEANKAASEKDAEKAKNEKNLHVEGESTSQGGKQEDANISSISDLFGAGGFMGKIKRFGS